MSSGSIRIIQLPEKSSVNTDDYMAVDSSANGTKKVKFTDLLDDNLSTQNKAADAQATGEAINDISARVDNMINTQTNGEVTTLWTGQINLKNETANLSESINNFDFIDVYCGGTDTVFARQHVSGNSVHFELQAQNMSDDASVQFMRWWETGLTISGTTATINKAIKCFWDDFSTAPIVSQATGGGIDIVRIDGVKIGHVENDEIVDARVGVDGTSYPTLGDAIRGQVTDLKSEINFTDINSTYKISVNWESGAINGSTGAEETNANYSRTTDYIPTTNADYVVVLSSATLIQYDYENGNYVRKASKYVRAADSPYPINKSYGYFRISGGTRIANHPEREYLIYKNTKAQADIETVKSRMLGKYKSPMYFGDGKSASWVQTALNTILELPHGGELDFEGFSTEPITVNDILAVADASSLTTVSGDTIQGNNFAIIYNIATKAISIKNASTYTYNNADEIVLFAVAWNSFVVGAIVDAVIRRSYERNITRLAQVEAAIDSGTHLPSYWLEYLSTKIADVQAKDMDIGNHGDSFVFVTDLHYNTNDGNSAGATDYILDHTSVSKVVIGGDICNGATASKADCINQIIACRNAFRKINPYYLRGNHDNNTEITNPTAEKAISDSELYGLILKPIENKIVGNRELHYYFDNPVQKIRYICLDTGHPDTNVISDAQITWMQGLITELASGWTVIVLTHQYYSNAGTGERDGNGDKILAGLNAIYDTADAVIACVICGHSHRDYMETTAKGFPIICTTCDVRGGESGGLVRTDNTYTEQAFDVFHIDTTARKIYATRIGAGSDRNTTY